jgi:hypothetical protein
MLAAPPCPHEADMVRELRPVDRVQEHVLGTDRHQAADPSMLDCGLSGIMRLTSQRSAPGRAWHDGI